MDHSDYFVIEDGVLKEYNVNTQIILPEGVREIGDGAFAYYLNIVSVTLPEGLERIGERAFYMCDRLKSINIPESVKEIGASAFRGCCKLSTITQPTENAVLADDAFRECTGLIDKNGFLIVGNVLYGYYGSDDYVVIPQSVKKIGRKAFSGYGDISENAQELLIENI